MDDRDRTPTLVGSRGQPPQALADVLERVLDKGIVIVGDIQVRLLDIELLTIKLRLMVASVERAREMGINWWEGDPFVNTQAHDGGEGERERAVGGSRQGGSTDRELELQRRVDALEQQLRSRAAEQEVTDGSR